MAIEMINSDSYIVHPLPQNYRGLDNSIFKSFLTYFSIPIVGMSRVPERALKNARYEMRQIFQRAEYRIPDLESTNPIIIIAEGENKGFWQGDTEANIAIVNSQELVDPNASRSIFVHEVGGHLLHHSLSQRDKDHILELYETRPPRGKGYADKNVWEYFAEGVSGYFDAQGMSSYPAHTRETLQALDERLYSYIRFCFGLNDWKWTERDTTFSETPLRQNTKEYFYD